MQKAPIYIVSGFPRSGTSMMMRAVDAGGIPAVWLLRREADLRRCGLHVDPNPHYELDFNEAIGWPAIRGRVVKVLSDHLDRLPSGERLQVVYMRRDPREITDSYPPAMEGTASYADRADADLRFLSGLGADVQILDFVRVINNPAEELSKLGWPIDVAAAATMVEPALYRRRVS